MWEDRENFILAWNWRAKKIHTGRCIGPSQAKQRGKSDNGPKVGNPKSVFFFVILEPIWSLRKEIGKGHLKVVTRTGYSKKNLNQDCRKFLSFHRTLPQQWYNVAPETISKQKWLEMVGSKVEGNCLHPQDHRKSWKIIQILNWRKYRPFWPFVKMWHLKS